jgi:hypothetical protein
MAIPKWRDVRYTDDGCTIYECLNCYYRWEARSSPKIFCTNCGIKWDGEQVAEPEDDKLVQALWDGQEAFRKSMPRWIVEVQISKPGTDRPEEWRMCFDTVSMRGRPSIDPKHERMLALEYLRRYEYAELQQRKNWLADYGRLPYQTQEFRVRFTTDFAGQSEYRDDYVTYPHSHVYYEERESA